MEHENVIFDLGRYYTKIANRKGNVMRLHSQSNITAWAITDDIYSSRSRRQGGEIPSSLIGGQSV